MSARLVFSRGTLIQATGAKPSASPPVALTFSWEKNEPSGYFSEGGRESSLTLRKISDDLYQAEDPIFGEIYLAKTPWWSELPSPPANRGVWLSYQGFFSGIWHDGVFGRFEDGQWTDLILPGPAFHLEFGRSRLALEDPLEFWQDEKHFAQKQSLVASMRERYPNGFPAPTLIKSTDSAADSILSLLLLRLAFPHARFHTEPKDPAWKRLAQNLNIEPLKEPFRGPELFSPASLGPREKLLELLFWQQKKSPFIPLNLWASLSD